MLADYVIKHAQEMSEDVMRSHIDLYVNDYSISLGKKGRSAIEKMLINYNLPLNESNIFVD
jgi:1,4-dihydroxy-6-naphthoate synthase